LLIRISRIIAQDFLARNEHASKLDSG